MTYAIHYIHKISGLSLQDIKPGNIMLCEKQFKFSDLGMVKIIANDYAPYTFGGTPCYLPPWLYAINVMKNVSPKWQERNIFQQVSSEYK